MFLQWPPAQENEKGAAHVLTIAVSRVLTLGEGLAEKAAERDAVRIFPRLAKNVYF